MCKACARATCDFQDTLEEVQIKSNIYIFSPMCAKHVNNDSQNTSKAMLEATPNPQTYSQIPHKKDPVVI